MAPSCKPAAPPNCTMSPEERRTPMILTRLTKMPLREPASCFYVCVCVCVCVIGWVGRRKGSLLYDDGNKLIVTTCRHTHQDSHRHSQTPTCKCVDPSSVTITSAWRREMVFCGCPCERTTSALMLRPITVTSLVKEMRVGILSSGRRSAGLGSTRTRAVFVVCVCVCVRKFMNL